MSNSIDNIRKKIDAAMPITWADLADCFKQDRRTIRRWIEDNCPEVQLPESRNKVTFSPAEARCIVDEWVGKY